MKQVFRNNRGQVYVKDAPMPRLQGSGAIVQTICSIFGEGSELGGIKATRRAIEAGQPPAEPLQEHPMSYQSVGRIVELSDDLKGVYSIGDVVACAGAGFGHHAEYGYVPKNTMAKVPEGVTPEEAATCNVGLTALHCLRRAGLQPGETMAVIGLGVLGQILVQLIYSCGGRAIGTDLYPLRLRKAASMGAEAVVDGNTGDLAAEVAARTGGLGADYVAVCVGGRQKAVNHLAVRTVRHSGVVLMIGGAVNVDFSDAPPDSSPHIKEIDLRWVYGRGPGSREADWNTKGLDYPRRFVRWDAHNNLEALLHLQATGRLRVEPLLTHRFPVERASEAADLLIDRPGEALGVVLEYGTGE
ncbi:MAG: zinc-dependent alcohol dehydrogenase [Anaerolineae bacterium]|mgnify:CR=1 FL=1|jgi:threonine dehydrogenase-like Zn-dependent dehydrogenase